MKQKKWQKRFMAIVSSLGFTDKVKEGALTAEDQKAIFAEYEKQHNISFLEDRAKNEDADPEEQLLSAEEQAELAKLLNVTPEDAPKTPSEAVKTLTAEVKDQKITIEVLSKQPEVENPVQVNAAGSTPRIVLVGAAHSATHLFGIDSPLYARGKWYNDNFITRSETNRDFSQEEKKEFMSAVSEFFNGVKKRSSELEKSGQIGLLDFSKMISGESHIDYTSLTGTAGEFVARRTDAILAYFRTLPTVSHIFPVVSNVQNKEIAPSANFAELSQGYREGRIFKGNVRFAAEVYSVVDLMFKYKFSDLIKLEKMYIGYLNREGSNVIKWTFIEWIMVYFGKILINEQQIRRVSGVRVPQQNVVANPANLGADGVLRAIERVEEELKVLPFEKMKLYDKSSIIDYFNELYDAVNEILPSMNGFKIYANARHKQWFVRGFRDKYHLDTDFTGSSSQLQDVTPESIVWVPNMPKNCYKVWVTVPGNIENYEDKPNEMLAFYFERDFEDILTMSRWKEGAGLLQAGIQYKTKSELEASGRENQWIFTNYPISALTLAASVSFKDNVLFEISGSTQVNTVSEYKPDLVYKLVAKQAGDKITKAGAFAKISKDFTAAAAGDYIKVYAELEDYTTTVDGENVKMTRPTGKFLELSRKVTA